MAIATFEGNLTLHDCLDVLEWEDVVEIVRHGQNLVTEREQREADRMSAGFNAMIEGQGTVVKAIGNLTKLMGKVFG